MAKLYIIIAWPQRINTVALNLLLRILRLRKELWLTNLQIFEPIPGHGVFSYPTFFSIICVSYSFWVFGFFFFDVYLFLREIQSVSVGGEGAEREGDTESKAGPRLQAVSTEPDAGLKLMNKILTWAEVRHSADWTTQSPSEFPILIKCCHTTFTWLYESSSLFPCSALF